MSSLVSSLAAHLLVTLRGRLLAGGVVATLVAVALVPSPSTAAPESIPQLGSGDFGWNANFWDFQLDPPPGSGHGPMRTDPKYPYQAATLLQLKLNDRGIRATLPQISATDSKRN